MIDNQFSQEYQYYKGQYCVYNGTLYRARNDIPVGTPFSTDNWEYRQIGLDLYTLNSNKVYKEGHSLQLTRTNNQYVNVTDFNRLGAYIKNGMLCFNCNLNLSSSITSSMSDFLEIGRISNWNCPYGIVQVIPHTSSSDGSIVTLQITSDGIIKIFSTRASAGFYRCFITGPSTSN